MDINIYTKELSAGLIPKIIKRFADFDMDIEFHPKFKFDEKADIGFLPIKLKLVLGKSKQYDNINHEILTGFELFFSSYDFEEELKFIQEPIQPKTNLLSKLFGNKKTVLFTENFVADEELDKLLKDCNKSLMLNWKSWNKSELRISLFFAAILAELTNGVIYDPQNGRYLSGKQALQIFPIEIEDYEQSIIEDEFTVVKFEGWS